MLKPKVRMWKAQSAAILLTLLAFTFTLSVLGRIPEGRYPLLVLLLASALSAAYGGLIAGVVSTILGVVLIAYVYEPFGTLYIADPPNVNMNPAAITAVGGSQPHTNFQPYLCVNFIISLFGLFPSPT